MDQNQLKWPKFKSVQNNDLPCAGYYSRTKNSCHSNWNIIDFKTLIKNIRKKGGERARIGIHPFGYNLPQLRYVKKKKKKKKTQLPSFFLSPPCLSTSTLHLLQQSPLTSSHSLCLLDLILSFFSSSSSHLLPIFFLLVHGRESFDLVVIERSTTITIGPYRLQPIATTWPWVALDLHSSENQSQFYFGNIQTFALK